MTSQQNQPQDYASWMQSQGYSINTRSGQKALVEDAMQNDPRFAGLSFGETADVMADVTGFAPFKRFTATAVNRTFDWLGANFTEAATEARPSDLGLGGDYTYGEYLGGGLRNVAQALGASDPDTLGAFYEAGKTLPAIGGALAIGALGAVASPLAVIATPVMLGTMYGQGLDMAYGQGVMGPKAVAIGAIGAGATLGTMALGRPLANAAGKAALRWMGGEAAKDLTKFTASEAVTLMSGEKLGTLTQRMLVRGTQEALVEGAAATIGIASNVGQMLILDHKEFLENQMWDKRFWIPTLIGETFASVAGVTMGRVKKPTGTAEEIRARYAAQEQAQPIMTGQEQSELAQALKPEAPAPEAVKTPHKLPPPDIAKEQVTSATETATIASNAQRMTKQRDESRAGKVELDEKGQPKATVAAIPRTVDSTPQAIGEAADALAAIDPLPPVVNRLDDPLVHIEAAQDQAHPSIDKQSVISTALERINARAVAESPQHHRIDTDSDGTNMNYFMFHNPQTKQRGTFVEIARFVPAEGKMKAVSRPREYDADGNLVEKTATILTPQRLIDWAVLDDARAHIEMSEFFGVELTPTEFQKLQNIGRRVVADMQEIPVLKFHDDVHANDPMFAADMATMLHQLGVIDALRRNNASLYFTSRTRGLSPEAFEVSPFDYLASGNAAQIRTTDLPNGRKVYAISRFEKFSAETDPHEISHVIDYLIRDGAFIDGEEGARLRAEWIEWANAALGDANAARAEKGKVSRIGAVGAEMAQTLLGKDLNINGKLYKAIAPEVARTKTFREQFGPDYYTGNVSEIAAQTVQAYLFTGTKHKRIRDLMQKHFPRLHSLFERFINYFRSSKDAPEERYSPRVKRGIQLLRSMLDGYYNATVDHAKLGLQPALESSGLTGRARQMFVHAWFEHSNPQFHEVLKLSADRWKVDPDANEAKIVDDLRMMMHYEKLSGFAGFDLATGRIDYGEVVSNLPWVRYLETGTENLHDTIYKYAQASREKAAAQGIKQPKVHKAWFSPKPVDEILKDLRVSPKHPKYKELRDYLTGRELMKKNWSRLREAAAQVLSPDVERPIENLSSILKQLYAFDEGLRDWYLGRLPYQEGRPMYEPTWAELGSDPTAAERLVGKVEIDPNADAVKRERAEKHWAPHLVKELQKRVNKQRAARKTLLRQDGTFEFAETTGKRRNDVRKFARREEAEEYIAHVENTLEFSRVRLVVESVDAKQPYFRIRVYEGNRKMLAHAEELADIQIMDRTLDQAAMEARETRAAEALDYERMQQQLEAPQRWADSREARREAQARADVERQLARERMGPPPTPPNRLEAILSTDSYQRYKADIALKQADILATELDIIPVYLRYLYRDINTDAQNQLAFRKINGEKLLPSFTEFKKYAREFEPAFRALGEYFGMEKDFSYTSNNLTRLIEAYAEFKLRMRESKQKDIAEFEYLVEVLPLGPLQSGESVTSAPKAFFSSLDNIITKIRGALEKQSMQRTVDGKLPLLSPSEHGKSLEKIAGFGPYVSEHSQKNISSISQMGPGGVTVHGGMKPVWNVMKQAGWAPLGLVQKVHNVYGGNMISMGQQKPAFEPLSNATYREHKQAAGDTQRALRMLDVEVEWVDVNGVKIVRPTKAGENGKKDPRQVTEKLYKDSRLRSVVSDIMRLQNVADGKFQDIVAEAKTAPENDPVRMQVESIQKRIQTPEEADMINEFLHRAYAAQYITASLRGAQDVTNFVKSFAVSLIRYEYFKGSARAAETFANEFSTMTTQDKIQAMLEVVSQEPKIQARVQADPNGKGWRDDMVTGVVGTFEDGLLKIAQANEMMRAKPWYVSESRTRKYHVRVDFPKLREKGKRTEFGYYDFDTLDEANAFIAEQKAKGNYPGKIIDYGASSKMYRPVSTSVEQALNQVTTSQSMLAQLLLDSIGVDSQTIADVASAFEAIPAEVIAQNEATRISKVEKMKRKFVDGRENLDMFYQQVKGISRSLAAVTRKETDLVFKLYGQDAEVLKDPAELERFEQWKRGLRLADSEFQKNIGMFGYMSCMWMNVSSALIEVMQGPSVTGPMLLARGASLKDAFVTPTLLTGRVGKNTLKRLIAREKANEVWADDEFGLIREAEMRNFFAHRRHNDVSDQMTHAMLENYRRYDEPDTWWSKTKMFGQKFYEITNGFYGYMNRFNMETGLIAMYRVLKKQVPKSEMRKDGTLPEHVQRKLYDDAMMFIDIANGTLQRLGRPEWATQPSQNQRNIAASAWSLQSFVNAQIGNLLTYAMKAWNPKGNFSRAEVTAHRKAISAFMGINLMAMGMAGIPLYPSIVKIINMLFGRDLENDMKEVFYDLEGLEESDKKFLADFANFGIGYALGIPADYGTRIAVSGIGPISPYEGFDPKQLGGPVVGLAAQAAMGMGKVATGTQNLGEAALNFLPLGLRRGLRLAAFDDGMVYDGNKKFMFDPTVPEQISMILGFNTISARKEMQMRMKTREAELADTKLRRKHISAVIDTIQRGDLQTARKLNEDAARLFYRELDARTGYDTFANAVAEEATQKELGQKVRQGAGPNAQRAARLWNTNRANDATFVDRLQTHSQYMMKLGIQPKNLGQKLVRAQTMDYMQALQPGASAGLLSQGLRNPAARLTIYDAMSNGSARSFLQDWVADLPSYGQ